MHAEPLIKIATLGDPMAATLFPPRPVPLLALGDAVQFPLQRIFCVGRNYAEHAAEMGAVIDRDAPFYFLKSPWSFLASGQDMPYPPRTADLHHEMELTVAIGASAKNILPEKALTLVAGYGCGLDMTRRDLQAEAKARRRPWDTGKDFENAAILAPLTPAAAAGKLTDLPITLSVNGQTRQSAHLRDMVWSVAEIIADLSTLFTLMPGDLIMMGTPAGVGPVVPGDVLSGQIGSFAPVQTRIV